MARAARDDAADRRAEQRDDLAQITRSFASWLRASRQRARAVRCSPSEPLEKPTSGTMPPASVTASRLGA